LAYDIQLAERVRDALLGLAGLTERCMFGGVGFLLHGNMLCGVLGEEIILRLGPKAHEQAVTEPGTRAFSPTGRPMRGWIAVGAEALAEPSALAEWIDRAIQFTSGLDPRAYSFLPPKRVPSSLHTSLTAPRPCAAQPGIPAPPADCPTQNSLRISWDDRGREKITPGSKPWATP